MALDTDVNVMAHSWRIRVRLWTFALVRRLADLPFPFADVRRFGVVDFPKLRTRVRFPSPALGFLLVSGVPAHRISVRIIVDGAIVADPK